MHKCTIWFLFLQNVELELEKIDKNRTFRCPYIYTYMNTTIHFNSLWLVTIVGSFFCLFFLIQGQHFAAKENGFKIVYYKHFCSNHMPNFDPGGKYMQTINQNWHKTTMWYIVFQLFQAENILDGFKKGIFNFKFNKNRFWIFGILFSLTTNYASFSFYKDL